MSCCEPIPGRQPLMIAALTTLASGAILHWKQRIHRSTMWALECAGLATAAISLRRATGTIPSSDLIGSAMVSSPAAVPLIDGVTDAQMELLHDLHGRRNRYSSGLAKLACTVILETSQAQYRGAQALTDSEEFSWSRFEGRMTALNRALKATLSQLSPSELVEGFEIRWIVLGQRADRSVWVISAERSCKCAVDEGQKVIVPSGRTWKIQERLAKGNEQDCLNSDGTFNIHPCVTDHLICTS